MALSLAVVYACAQSIDWSADGSRLQKQSLFGVHGEPAGSVRIDSDGVGAVIRRHKNPRCGDGSLEKMSKMSGNWVSERVARVGKENRWRGGPLGLMTSVGGQLDLLSADLSSSVGRNLPHPRSGLEIEQEDKGRRQSPNVEDFVIVECPADLTRRIKGSSWRQRRRGRRLCDGSASASASQVLDARICAVARNRGTTAELDYDWVKFRFFLANTRHRQTQADGRRQMDASRWTQTTQAGVLPLHTT